MKRFNKSCSCLLQCNNLYKLIFTLSLFYSTGCQKLVQVAPPVTTLNPENIYTADATAAAVLTGLYANLSFNGVASISSTPIGTSVYCGLSADEFTLLSGAVNMPYTQYYENQLNNSVGVSFWSSIYPLVYDTNTAIEGLNSSTSLTPAVKQQLLGEAMFCRAFLYFYLVNLYGDVPLALTSNYQTNATLARAPQAQVYQQIVADLKQAQSLLSSNFLDATVQNTSIERVRPSKWAATALLARVYLYYGNLTGDATNYTNAVTETTTLINNTSTFGLSPLNNVFLRASLGNNEAIWQLQPVNATYDVIDALEFVLPSTGPSQTVNPMYLNTFLVNAFEPGDQRKANWVDSVMVSGSTFYYAYKYKNVTANSTVNEYVNVLRLGEQYLIRAEANANLGNGAASATDLNAIRNRAGLPNYTGATDKASLLTAILKERRVEFFTEWGHRWLDLKRTATINSVMTAAAVQKGSTWNPDQALYPIPLTDLQHDVNLKQNPGY